MYLRKCKPLVRTLVEFAAVLQEAVPRTVRVGWDLPWFTRERKSSTMGPRWDCCSCPFHQGWFPVSLVLLGAAEATVVVHVARRTSLREQEFTENLPQVFLTAICRCGTRSLSGLRQPPHESHILVFLPLIVGLFSCCCLRICLSFGFCRSCFPRSNV